MQPTIVTFSGVSGVGKTTLVSHLLEANPEYGLIKSVTTRPKRPDDIPGEYQYISEKKFQRREQAKKFIWSQPFCGYYYGTEFATLDAAQARSALSLMIITYDRIVQLHTFMPEQVLSFYLLAPPEEELRRRMTVAGRNMADIEQRLARCRQEDAKIVSSNLPVLFLLPGSREELEAQVKSQLALLAASH